MRCADIYAAHGINIGEAKGVAFAPTFRRGQVAKNRVHLDVRAAPGLQGKERITALKVKCDRLVALGATRVRRYEPTPPMSAGFIVMTDPEDSEFCLD